MGKDDFSLVVVDGEAYLVEFGETISFWKQFKEWVFGWVRK